MVRAAIIALVVTFTAAPARADDPVTDPALIDKLLARSWKCTGRGLHASMDEIGYKAKLVGKRDLGGNWVGLTYTQTTRWGRYVMKAVVGWRSMAKEIVLHGVDTSGDDYTLLAPAPDPDATAITFTGSRTPLDIATTGAAGAEVTTLTFELTAPRKLAIKMQRKDASGTEVAHWTDACTR
jgi:hypothetical protein